MSHFASTADPERAFRSVYTEVYPDLLRFVQRRTAPDQAEDVVAEVFLVVWRRLEDLPRPTGEARAWVFGVARNVLLNAHRTERRRDALGIRLADPTLQPPPEAGTDGVIDRVDLTQAWRWLSARDQEAIALAVFPKNALAENADGATFTTAAGTVVELREGSTVLLSGGYSTDKKGLEIPPHCPKDLFGMVHGAPE